MEQQCSHAHLGWPVEKDMSFFLLLLSSASSLPFPAFHVDSHYMCTTQAMVNANQFPIIIKFSLYMNLLFANLFFCEKQNCHIPLIINDSVLDFCKCCAKMGGLGTAMCR